VERERDGFEFSRGSAQENGCGLALCHDFPGWAGSGQGFDFQVGIGAEPGRIQRHGGDESGFERVVEVLMMDAEMDADVFVFLAFAGPDHAGHAAFAGDGFGEGSLCEFLGEGECAVDVGFSDAVAAGDDGELAEVEAQVVQGTVSAESELAEGGHGGGAMRDFSYVRVRRRSISRLVRVGRNR